VGPEIGVVVGSGISEGAGGETLGAAAASVACLVPVLKMGAAFCAVVPNARTTQLEQTTTPRET
jgi:hypothetical protein